MNQTELQQIQSLLNNYIEGDELEIRLGSFTTNFNSTNPKRIFDNIKQYFTDKGFNKSIIYNTIHMFDKRIKKIIDEKSQQCTTIKKNVINIVDIKRLNIRIALNEEIIISDNININEGKYYTKNRKRISFTHPNHIYKVDLSIDQFIYSTEKTYQIEVEFIKKPTIEEIIDIIIILTKIM